MVRLICRLAIMITASALLLCPAHAGTPDTKSFPTRGIAVLASSIGSDVTPEALAEFVEQGKFSPVIIDWAWITYHWNHTDFAAVNKFLELMATQKVPVAAMYRPRFLSNPTVATQMDDKGQRDMDHAMICYSNAAACKWGISWGEKILEKCPSFREIIIYNPLNLCHCPQCTAASGHTAVMNFLSEAKSAWRAKQPEVKLGVVYMPATEFWKAGMAIIDIAHPYLRIKSDIDPAEDVANIKTVRAILGEKMGSCLGKITWEPPDKVSLEKLKTIDDLARKAGISYFFWDFETLFRSSLYDPKAVIQALRIGQTVPVEAVSDEPAAERYTTEETRSKPLEYFLERMYPPEPGHHQFAAMWALIQKGEEADFEARGSIISTVVAAINDKSRPFKSRWECCYVLSGIGDERAVPELIQVLEDGESGLTVFAAEALATLFKDTHNDAAHAALVKAAAHNSAVREVLTRRLGESVAAEPSSAAATAADELAPSGPPKPPPGPKPPVAKPLPWPFPGDYKAQNVFNNYQQPTDTYIHCGLDFLHPVGTPVTAVASGYVACIATNYPEWNTHHFFIITPEKGGSRGWCYVHLDPSTFTFKVGDHIRQGQLLGKLVKFSVGGKPGGACHLHLHYVSFTKDAKGKVMVHSLLDPLYFFDWKDTVPPAFQPLRFVHEGSLQQFQADASGIMTLNGKVDILAAITDSAYPGHVGNLGVPVVMLSISDGTHTIQKLVLDHRGDLGEARLIKPLYLTLAEKKAWINLDSFPRYQVLRVTKTDGDGKITPKDADECWDTTAMDNSGKPLWPDGQYSVNVYAWDIAGNQGIVGAKVQVKNEP